MLWRLWFLLDLLVWWRLCLDVNGPHLRLWRFWFLLEQWRLCLDLNRTHLLLLWRLWFLLDQTAPLSMCNLFKQKQKEISMLSVVAQKE